MLKCILQTSLREVGEYVKVKLHRYINAGAVSVPSSHHRITTVAVPVTPVVASTSSTLPIARCRGVATVRPAEPYYNDIASPGMSQDNS